MPAAYKWFQEISGTITIMDLQQIAYSVKSFLLM